MTSIIRLIVVLFLLEVCIGIPVKAYAGPGVAIGAMIVFITVILSFSASIFISVLNFIKRIIKMKKGSKNNLNSKQNKTKR